MTQTEVRPAWPGVRFTEGRVPGHDKAEELAGEIRRIYAPKDGPLDLDHILKQLNIKVECRRIIKKASELLPVPDRADNGSPFRILIDPRPPEGSLDTIEDAVRDAAVTLQHQFLRALQLGHTFFYDWEPADDLACGPTRKSIPDQTWLDVQHTLELESDFCRYFACALLWPDYEPSLHTRHATKPNWQDYLKLLRDIERLD